MFLNQFWKRVAKDGWIGKRPSLLIETQDSAIFFQGRFSCVVRMRGGHLNPECQEKSDNHSYPRAQWLQCKYCDHPVLQFSTILQPT